MSECVFAWKNSARTCQLVDLALACMALAVYSRTRRHPAAALEAASRYQTVLQIAQKQIIKVKSLKVNGDVIDACLLASFLMGRYEGAVYHDRSGPDTLTSFRDWSHYDGLTAVLKVWNDRFQDSAASPIVKYTRRQILKFDLLRHIPLPYWLKDGARFGEVGSELDYDCLAVRLNNLHFAYNMVATENVRDTTLVHKLLEEAKELDEALQAWSAQITKPYQEHTIQEPERWPLDHFYSLTTYIYSSIGQAAIWVEYFSTRMLVNSVTIRLIEKHSYLICERARNEAYATITTMTNNLTSSIPFCLDRIRVESLEPTMWNSGAILITSEDPTPYLANFMVWPLTVGSALECICPQQRSWFESELTILGRIAGEDVLAYAATNQWISL